MRRRPPAQPNLVRLISAASSAPRIPSRDDAQDIWIRWEMAGRGRGAVVAACAWFVCAQVTGTAPHGRHELGLRARAPAEQVLERRASARTGRIPGPVAQRTGPRLLALRGGYFLDRAFIEQDSDEYEQGWIAEVLVPTCCYAAARPCHTGHLSLLPGKTAKPPTDQRLPSRQNKETPEQTKAREEREQDASSRP